MSLFQLTEYLLWKSLNRKTGPISTEHVNNLKQECIDKQEIFDNVICRVCTNTAEIRITERIGDTLIISALRTVANISITEADYYPKYVCKKCLEELKIAFQFKKKCEASDMMFRKAISSETVLVSSSQPMIKHDFSLLLHQMQEKRNARNFELKRDEFYDDDVFRNEDLPEFLQTQDSTKVLDIIHKKKIKRSVKIPSNMDITTKNRILNIIENSEGYIDGAQSEKIKINDIDNDESKKKPLKTHKCRRCDLKFDTKGEFQKHQKENGCIYHACPLCGKLVLKLASHERIVHSRTHKYTCHKCGKIYYSSGALINHMHIHRDTKEYFCDHCPYRGKRKSYLVCHMRVHTGEHRYLCSMCPLKFTSTSNLAKHQLVHFSKKFECCKCKKKFRQQRHLKEHFDAAHLNIRYRCSICGKDLTSRKKLLSHELHVHKREKHKLFEEVQRVVIGNDND